MMLFSNVLNFTLWASIIEFAGSVIIVFYMLRAIATLLRTKNIALARLIVADGIITGLSFRVAATLLKTLQLQSWQQILMFAAIFTLSTVLKKLFAWERLRLQM